MAGRAAQDDEEVSRTEPLRIVVTGSRKFGCSELEADKIMLSAVRAALVTRNPYDVPTLSGVTVIIGEGGAPGADRMAREWAIRRGSPVAAYRTYVALWSQDGKAAGHIRNGRMLKEHCPELVLAIWDGSVLRSGTHNCMTQAAKLGIPILIHPIQRERV